MRAPLRLLAPALLLAAGCTPDGGILSASGSASPEPPLPDRCPVDPHHFIFLETDTTIYRQGQTVRLTPRYDMSPAGTREIPLDCTSGWSLSGPARLSADRRSFAIDADAPVGAEIVIGYRFGVETATARFRVIGRDEIVLTGTRGQRSVEGCEGLAPVRELVFAPGNRFAVTFQPFETYKDYWGTYTFDPGTGALVMQVESGNNIPPGLDLDGRASLDAAGRLILEGVYLGNHVRPYPAPPGGCRYIF